MSVAGLDETLDLSLVPSQQMYMSEAVIKSTLMQDMSQYAVAWIDARVGAPDIHFVSGSGLMGLFCVCEASVRFEGGRSKPRDPVTRGTGSAFCAQTTKPQRNTQQGCKPRDLALTKVATKAPLPQQVEQHDSSC